MNRLPHWCLTDKFPAFYDTESATAIEQTAKLWGAMNTLIDSYNTWVDKINNDIEAFENNTDKNIELFEKELRQEFHDFINDVELKLILQDKDIKDAVTFMTTNLNNSVTTLLNEMRENGELNDAILTAFENLDAKIKLTTDAILKEFENLDSKIKFTTVENFGCVGDGVTDDTQPITDAIAYCNENKLTLIFSQKQYLITPSDTGIFVDCNIDFNGAEIISNGSGKHLFVVGEFTEAIEIDNTVFTKNNFSDVRLHGKSFALETPLSMGLRWGSGVEGFYTEHFCCDNTGDIINGEFNPQIIDGTYKCYNVRDIDEKPTTIKNGIFTANDTGTTRPVFIMCCRNNVTIENFSVNFTLENENFNDGVFKFTYCSNIQINNINGKNPYGVDVAGYVISCSGCSNVSVKHCNLYNKNGLSWGSFGMTSSSNICYENCNTQRIDMHNSGNYTVKNCTINFCSISGGYGNISIEDSRFLPRDREYEKNSIILRNDYGLLFSGKLIIKNCVFDNNNYVFNFYQARDMLNVETFNFKGLHVIVENSTFNNPDWHLLDLYFTDENWSKLISFTFNNCDIDCITFIKTTNNIVGSKMNILSINNCRFTAETLYFMRFTFNKILIDSSQFTKIDFNYECDSVISIINSFLDRVNTKTSNTVKLIGNIIGYDYYPGLLIEPTNKIINNNILITETKNYQNAWNNIIV